MKIRIIYLIMAKLLCLALAGCSNDFSSIYGVKTVHVENGQAVYFKREVWGTSGDQLVISASQDRCLTPNPDKDYIYKTMGPIEIYYKSFGDTLTLYSTVIADFPKNNSFPVKIIQNEVNPSEFVALKSKANILGLKPLTIDVDRGLKCK